ncbi:hypothetical protein [Microbacterium sp. Leaf159]|uniref:hypothetical protein n=1 Tax=Microbacterium sp. Leaf159 TaxID=1736279 RepID=UPI0006F60CC6|nr:hypothetical protein [Microbacterium sp. Leaf159]KQR39531.1 hypothetical protein ASF80_09020 [Microbacterium sp. Leaf159]
MTIDTTTHGDPAQVRAAAEWLDPGLKDAADASSKTTSFIPTGVRSHWHGESADDYVTILLRTTDAANEIRDQAGDAAEKLRSYAGQLERMRDDFAAHRDNARAQGLPVNGMVIGRPVSLLSTCPATRDDPNWDAWQEHLDRIDLYNEIATDVGAWWGELEVWISENLDAFLGGLPGETTAEKILSGLNEAGGEMPKIYLDGQGLAWKNTASDLVSHADELRTGASDFVSDLRSGNPATKAAAEAANPQGMRWAADEAEDLARGLSRASKAVPFVGWGIDLWDLGTALESGDDPSSTAVEIGGGLLGGAAAGLGVAGLAAAGIVTLPVWGTAVVVGGAAVAVGAGAVWAYESWVPQDVRESIDAGLSDAWDASTDFAEGAWENTTDVVGDVGHGIGRAWKGVFG